MVIPTGDKSTWEGQAHAIVQQGYPAVAHLLPSLILWLQDMNWPGAVTIAKFLASIGSPVIPHVKQVLSSTDDIWKHWVLTEVCSHWPKGLIIQIEPELRSLAHGTEAEGAGDEANRLLIQHGLG